MAGSTSEQGSKTKGVYVVGALCLWLFATAAFFGACPTYPVCSLFAVFLASALLGSIPWGVIISRVFYHTDVREHGSGNIGTTNAMRTMGKVGGSAVFLLDFGKGLASGLLAYVALCIVASAGVSQTSAPVAYEDLTAMAFLGCVWGHIFSPWLHFHGGKGIAVAIGCLFVMFGWQSALIEILLFAVIVVASRYVSAGSIAAALLCPILGAYHFLFMGFYPWAFAFCTVAALTVVWAHRENIARLRAGTERRVGSKKEA